MDVKKVTRLFKLSMAAGLLIPLFATLSCEVGLGESVDTAAPSVTITYPPVGAVIMEDFVLAGTYKDDKGIDEVSVTIKGTGLDNSDMELGPFKAEFDKESWKIRLNEKTERSVFNGYPIKDGPIEITVSVRDGANHITTEKLSVDIDNSAPVLIMSKPLSTASDESSTSYGRVFKLTGDIYDLHQSDGITVDFQYALNNGGSLGEVKSLEGYTINSSMTDDSPLIIAQYYTEAEAGSDESKKKNRANYLALYGTDADDGNGNTKDKEFYCSTILTDCAKIYQNPSDANGVAKGNSTDEYYINSNDFYNELQTEGGTRSAGKNYEVTATKLGKMFNGTGNDYSDAEKEEIMEVLHTTGNYAPSKAIDKEKSSKFLINPDNSPVWNISGYEAGFGSDGKSLNTYDKAEDPDGFRDLAQGGSVSINITAGKDKSEIRPETLVVKLRHYKTSDFSGTPEDVLVLLDDSDYYKEFRKENAITVNDLSTSLSVQFTPNSGAVGVATYKLNAGEYYIFDVSGVDRKGNDVCSLKGNTYGFMVKRTEASPETSYTVCEIIDDARSEKDIFDESAGNGFVSGKNPIDIAGTVNLQGDKFHELTPIKYSIEFTRNGKLLSDPSFGTDARIPTPTVVISKTQKSDVDSDWGIRISDWLKAKTTDGTETTLVPGKYNVKIIINVMNTTGAFSKDTITFTLDNKAPELSGETISPKVNGKINGKVVYKATIRDNNEVLKNGSTWEAVGVTDGSGVVAAEEIETTEINTRLITEETGTLTLKINVADTVKNTAEYTRTFEIDQSTDAPVIKAGNYKKEVTADAIAANNNLLGKKSNNVLYATISDDDGLANVQVWYKTLGAADWVQLGEYDAAGSMSYSLEANVKDLAEGKYDFKIVAVDNKQETKYATTEETFVLGISNGAPEIAVTTENNKWQKSYVESDPSTVFTISGTCGLTATHVYRYKNEDGTEEEMEITPLSVVEEDGVQKKSWSYTTHGTEGKEYYYFAVDQYGQRSSVSHKYRIDSIKPTVKSDWTNTDAAADKWHASESVALNIPLSDEWSGDADGSKIDSKSVSGIATVKYKIGSGDDWSDMVQGKKLDSNETNKETNRNYWYSFYKTTLNFPTRTVGAVETVDGEHTVCVKVTDDAGNELEKNYTYHVDTTAPVVKNHNIKLNDDAGTAVSAGDVLNAKQLKKGIKISAEITDAVAGINTSGIKEVKLLDNNKPLEITSAFTGGIYTYTILKDSIGNGDHTYAIEATDNAGNVSARSEFAVSVDKIAPKASISMVSPTVNGKNTDGTAVTYVNGIITVSGIASDETKLAMQDGSTVKKLVWKVDGSSETNYTGEAVLTNETYNNWTFELDTTKIDGDYGKEKGSTHVITVSVSDAAGNTVTSDPYTINIKQYTDIPVVTFNDLEDSIAMKNNGSDAYSAFGGANSNINFTVSDDDKIKSVKVYLDNISDPVYEKEFDSKESAKSTLTVSEFDLAAIKIGSNPINEGPHSIKLVVEDFELLNGKDDGGKDKGMYVTNLVWNDVTTEYVNDKNKELKFDFYYDTANPKIDENVVKVAGKTTNTKFSFGGTTSDSYGVKKITVKADKNGVEESWGEILPENFTSSETTGVYNWSIDLNTVENSIADGSYTVTITAIDKANKETKVIRPIVIDKTPPELHGNKVTVTSARSFPASGVASPDKEWYASSQLNVSLLVKDDDTGVKSVQWKNASVTDSSWSSLTQSSEASGVTGYDKWGGTLLLLDNDHNAVQGLNTIEFKITDGAGNEYKYNSSYPKVSPYVDTVNPKEPVLVEVVGALAGTPTTKIASNAADVEFTVKAEDDGTVGGDSPTAVGIAKVELAKIGSTTITSTPAGNVTVSQVEGAGNENKYKFTLNKNLFNSVGGGGDVIVKVTDKVGNQTTSASLFQIIVDNDAPEISLTNPADADLTTAGIQVNGNISITGKVSDANTISVPTFSFYKDETSVADPGTLEEGNWSSLEVETGAEAKVVLTKNDSDNHNWTLTVNTRSKFEDEKNYILRVAVKDIANNTGYAYLRFKVDQNTDRPVIRVSSPNSFKTGGTDAAPELMSSTNSIWQMGLNYISGTISDDDGVSKMYYSVNGGTDWTEITGADGGTWQITNLEDKGYSMLFKVTDAAGKTFLTGSDLNLANYKNSIRLTDGTYEVGTSERLNSTFYFAVDTKTPTISNLQYDFGTTYNVHAEKKPAAPEAGVKYLSDMLPGGKTNKFKLHLYAKDDNGIKSVVVANDMLGDAANGHTMALTASGTATADGVKYITDEIDISEWDSDTYQFTITVTDKAGSQAVTTTSITVDNDAPTVSMSNPAEGDSVYGISVSATGSVSDAKKLYYAISTSGTVKPNVNSTGTNTVSAWTKFVSNTDGNRDVTPEKSGDTNYGKLGNRDADFTEVSYKPVYTSFTECSGELSFKGTQWNLSFDGKEVTGETHVYRVNKWLTEMGVTSDALIKDKSFTDLVNLWLWIKAEDKAGNISETPFRIVVDPQGGRPTAVIGAPDEGGKVTGNVRVSGTASDPDGKVEKVFVQFISEQYSKDKEVKTSNSEYSTSVTTTVVEEKTSFTKFEPTLDDIKYMFNAGIEIWNFRAATPVKITSVDNITGNAANYGAIADYQKTGSWTLTVNENDEFVPAPDSDGNATTNKVAFAVYAIDDEGFISTPVYRMMEFDTEAPVIDNLELVKYEVTAGGAVDKTKEIARKTYSEDMYINDTWYLEGTVKDDTVYSLSVLGEKLVVKGNAPASGTKVVDNEKGNTVTFIKTETINGVDYKTYRFSVKLDASTKGETGAFSGAINASDQAGHQGRSNVTINVDRKAPVILAKGDSEKYNINPLIQNEDGFYTFGSQVTEDGNQSGFGFVAFYFMRRNSGSSKDKHYLYDIMLDKTGNANRTEVTSVPAGMKFEDGLYWRTQDITVDGTDRTIISGSFDTTNYRVGSLVKINGSYYIVTDNRNSGSLTLSEKIPGTETSITGAMFAVAQIVDHLTQETAGTTKLTSTTGGINGYFSNNVNEDYVDGDTRLGDFMVESVKKKGATWTWDASVNSKNISDGPVELHYVVFDAAGNYSIEVIGHEDAVDASGAGAKPYSGLDKDDAHLRYRKDDISVANNAPRLAKIFLGTNLDGSATGEGADRKATYQASEFVEYNVMDKLGKLSSTVEIETKKYNGKFFKIKDELAVMPEFVGGNGIDADHKIQAVFNNNATTSAVNTATATRALLAPAADTVLDIAGSEIAAEKNAIDSDTGKTYSASGSDLDGLKYHMYVYTFKNDTLGAESEDPEVGDRSMSWTFWDYTEDTDVGVDSSYCHVWIKDLVVDVLDDTSPIAKIIPFHWTSPTDTSVPVDADGNVLGHIDLEEDLGAASSPAVARVEKPKVSGRVYIDGTTYDATRLKSLFIKDPDGKARKVAEYYNGKWIAASRNSSGTIVYADMDGNTATPSSQWANGAADANKWPDNWYGLTINSEDRPSQDGHTVSWTFDIDMTPYGVPSTSKNVIAYAEDARTYTAEEIEAGKVNGNPSSSEAAAQTGYNAITKDRGDYTSTYEMDFVPYIKGIVGATRSRLGRYSVQAGSTVQLEIMNAKENDPVTINFYKTNTSTGKQSTTANATAQTKTAGAGGIVEITVPQYSCFVEATVSSVATPNNVNINKKYNIEEGYSVNRLGVEQGDPKNGTNYWTDDRYLSVWKVGNTFKNSPNPIKGTIERMTKSTTKFQASERKGNGHNGSYYKDGDIYAIWGSENNMIYDGVLSLQERWKSICDKDSGAVKTPTAEIDTCVINNRVFHTVLDDGWADAETFGKGLLLIRDGETFTADSGSNKLTIEQTKVDMVRDQFQNPKIAGYYTGTTADDTDGRYHMFVSYYDKHTHCLKYGKVEFSNKWPENLTEVVDSKNVANDTTGNYVVDGSDSTTSTADVGSFSDIKIINNKPVIVYYDKGNKKLKIAQANSNTPTSWTIASFNRPSGSSDFGRYVSMEVDVSGVHIVAQSALDGILYYGYVKNTSLTGTTISVDWKKVDSTSSVGRWTDIKLEDATKSGYAAKPVITYQDASKLNTISAVKIAYMDDVANGVWEAMTDPAVCEASDMKLSIAVDVSDRDSIRNRYGVAINSTELFVDFLRGEQDLTPSE